MPARNYLALDVGEKRIGLATADDNVRIAVPFGWLENNNDTIQKITEKLIQHDISVVVVGYPRNQSGEATQQTQFVEQFVKNLSVIDLDVDLVFQDESLTSVEAERRLGQVKDKGEIDAEAASIILQDYLESRYGN
ncbi:Holliday junction resolvase RuvX [Candidatus Saccharibacteria bacterium]|nr:Holliday junction resolvase RuvX [Candidatus Saccharibacteria bacterium]